jgi:hypothetical protein
MKKKEARGSAAADRGAGEAEEYRSDRRLPAGMVRCAL